MLYIFLKKKGGCHEKLVIAGGKAEIPTEIGEKTQKYYGKCNKKRGPG
jgi:hypothetical protein